MVFSFNPLLGERGHLIFLFHGDGQERAGVGLQ